MKIIRNLSKLLKDTDLKKEPVVVHVNKFDDDAVKKFNQEMSDAHNTGQKIIPIVINSPGGHVYSLMSMIDTIKSAELPVATISMGKSMSCGAILLTFGTEGYRFAAPNSTVMIHDVSSGTMGKIEELKTDVKEAERLGNIVFKMMAQNCGKPDDYFKNLIHEIGHADLYINAEDAKKHGIVNHIRVPKFIVNVSVDILFE